ncbi:MAG: hypothetical protein NC212_06710 [Staphylococcus sp.]|nr:hypothetical protein [Staphylococcus sp.]
MNIISKLTGMRVLLVTICLMGCLAFISCDKDNCGYPGSVTFSSKGGSKIIRTNEDINLVYMQILDYDGEGNYSDQEREDSLIVTYQWLTAKAALYGNEIELIAEPSLSSKKRTLYLDVNEDIEIKVTQK